MNEFEILSYFICFFNMATRQPPYLLLNSFYLVCLRLDVRDGHILHNNVSVWEP